MQILTFLLLFSLMAGCKQMKKTGKIQDTEDRFLQERLKMVERQIVRRGVKDERVLAAMRKVPRHKFVPENLQWEAYRDGPLPIGEGQTISQPFIVAYMTEQLQLEPTDRVLEIGTGSGYQAAVLAELCDSVFTIEIIPELSHRAQKTLKALGYRNIFFRIGDGYKGWTEKAPFDAIILTAAPPKVPQPLVDQLTVGGRLIAPVGVSLQQLILYRKTKEGIRTEKKLGVSFVPMRGEAESLE